MRIRGTQETVKPIEVNADTVYVRTNIVRIEEEDIDAMKGFSGWEYDEQVFNKNDYIEVGFQRRCRRNSTSTHFDDG